MYTQCVQMAGCVQTDHFYFYLQYILKILQQIFLIQNNMIKIIVLSRLHKQHYILAKYLLKLNSRARIMTLTFQVFFTLVISVGSTKTGQGITSFTIPQAIFPYKVRFKEGTREREEDFKELGLLHYGEECYQRTEFLNVLPCHVNKQLNLSQ